MRPVAVGSLIRDVTGDVAIQHTDGLLVDDTRWGLTDRLGSTIAQTQGSKIGQTARYSDWGVPTFATVGWNSQTGYTGELGDSITGLNTYYARAYQPMSGSWLSADPYRGTMADPGTLGRYGYVGGNPTTYTDAYGYRVQENGTSKYMGGSLKTCQQQYGFCPTTNGTTVTGTTPSSDRTRNSARHLNLEALTAQLDQYLKSCRTLQYQGVIESCTPAESDAVGRAQAKALNGASELSELAFSICMADFANPYRGGFRTTGVITRSAAEAILANSAKAATEVTAATSGAAIRASLAQLAAGQNRNVRVVATQAELDALYQSIAKGATDVTPPSYSGQMVELADGTRVGLRPTSSSGGATIDVFYPDGTQGKVHLG